MQQVILAKIITGKRCTKLDNGKSKLNNSCKNLVRGNQFCSLWAATRMYLHNSQTFLLH